MKKFLCVLLAVTFILSAAFTVSAFDDEENNDLLSADVLSDTDGSVPPLTKEEYDNMQKTVDFVCGRYRSNALGRGVKEVIYDKAVEMFPDNVEDPSQRFSPVTIKFDDIPVIVKAMYPYISDTTLNDMLISKIMDEYISLKDDIAEGPIYWVSDDSIKVIIRGGFGGIRYIKDADKGDFEGYTANSDGTYSLYFTVRPELEATEVLAEEELEGYYKLAAEATEEGFEYNGYRFYYSYSQADFFTYGEPEYREFNFSLTEDGKVIYNYDRWGVTLPEKFDDIPTDIIPGDMNGDEQTDNKDVVTLFRAVSGNSGGYNAVFDFNEDGEVNNKDVVALFRFVSAAK